MTLSEFYTAIGGAYRVRPLKEAVRQADLKMYENKARLDAQKKDQP